MISQQHEALELWGGIECTVARVGDTWRNQIEESGLLLDEAELDAIAALGIRRLRFPVIWETIAPEEPNVCHWDWHDERLAALRERGIAPIAGLIHHGSGPHYTNLLDPHFPELLAQHAERVAQRYPWIDAYTPVNEPLTTARFSGLYGHWYPHHRSNESYLRALIHQCKATVLAMQAIRRVRPDAQLVQTEDFGKTYSTPLLAYQAEHENHRRWLSYDLLHGRVDDSHPLYAFLLKNGIDEAELAFFRHNACPPDIIGINHYLTGERFLDEDLASYPECFHGGNGLHRYADVEAVRMHVCEEDVGPLNRLREVWERYRRPIAVTEAHHGCTREEQMRWLHQVWSSARALRDEGADIRAVTVWSLFGAVDWNTLLTQRNGFYEPGAFDARSTPPRRTGLSNLAQALATKGAMDHPALDAPGWWKRETRFYVPRLQPGGVATSPASGRHLLITGATGTLGRAFSRLCVHRGLPHVLLTRKEMDIADPQSVRNALDRYRPWAVINAAGYVRVPDAEREPDRCFRENTHGPATLAAECATRGLPLVSFSSDLVFDGELGRPYVESDPRTPRSVYGISKAEAEQRVMEAWPETLMVRTSAFFGPWDRYNFVYQVISRLMAGQAFEAPDDVIVSPTYVPDLVQGTLDLLVDGEQGVWHLANKGAVSWYELALNAAEEMKLSRELVARRPPAHPAITALSSERGGVMPSLDSALGRFLRECEVDWHAEVRA